MRFTKDEAYYIGLNVQKIVPDNLEENNLRTKTVEQVRKNFDACYCKPPQTYDLRALCEDLKRLNIMENNEDEYFSVRITHTIINGTILGDYVELKRDCLVKRDPAKARKRMSNPLVDDIMDYYE